MLDLQQFIEKTVVRDFNKRQKGCCRFIDNTIRREIRPYLIRYKQDKYLFQGTTIQLKINQNDFGVNLTRPTVPGGYRHPFVYSDGEICFDDDEDPIRWELDNVHFNTIKNYNTLDFSDMARRAIVHTHKLLTRGYFQPKNGKLSPVHKLNSENFPKEKRRGDML